MAAIYPLYLLDVPLHPVCAVCAAIVRNAYLLCTTDEAIEASCSNTASM